MNPRPGAIDIALLRIFRDDQIPANGRISLRELRREWAKLPFRKSDLDDALARLSDIHYLHTEVRIDGTYVVLLSDGEDRLHRLPEGPRESLKRLWDSLSLYAIDQRQPSPAGTRRNRRRSDLH